MLQLLKLALHLNINFYFLLSYTVLNWLEFDQLMKCVNELIQNYYRLITHQSDFPNVEKI